ncbi:Flp family type IVb pilin (plasmid) [Skermanella mucosa]|nr:Flp family type IVb pilin [Skermanella mucosa]
MAPALSSRRGVTALEYGLIASLIAVVIMVGVGQLGTNLNTMFSGLATTIGGVSTGGAAAGGAGGGN